MRQHTGHETAKPHVPHRVSKKATAKKTGEVTVREAVGVFHDHKTMQAAIDDLQVQGFMRQELSVLAGENAVKEKLGHLYKRTEDAEDDPKAPRMMFIATEEIGVAQAAVIGIPLFVAAVTVGGLVVASGGLLLDALIFAATAGAVGAGIGSMFSTFIAKERAEYLQKQLEHGGLLLWVHVRDAHMEELAKKILRKHSAEDVHVHEIPVQKEEE
jgi:hypothetical protein